MFFLTIPSHFQNPEPNEKNLGSQLREFLFWKFFEEKKNISCFSFWFWKLREKVKKHSVWMIFPICTPDSNKEFMWYYESKIIFRKITLQLIKLIESNIHLHPIASTVSFYWVAFKASLGFVVYCFPSRSEHSWYSDCAYQAFLHIATIGGTSTPWPPLPPNPLCQHSIHSLDGWVCDDFDDTLVTFVSHPAIAALQSRGHQKKIWKHLEITVQALAN